MYSIFKKTIIKAGFAYCLMNDQHYKKVIATTDKTLKQSPIWVNGNTSGGFRKEYLPQPNETFLEYFAKEFCKGNLIRNVLVGYDEIGDYGNGIILAKSPHNNETNSDMSIYKNILKVNHNDNTITIKPVKDSWNREELITLLEKCYDDGRYSTIRKDIGASFDKWLEQNL